MRKRGEITVFLSLIMVCIFSLILGLLESARTTGARLYLEMSANSAMASVMSQYNRNLWDMYHLLFLEYESETAVEQSFASYLKFYTDQENFYPMKISKVEMTGNTAMADDGGDALEQEILSYMKYRLPDVAADLTGIAEAAAEATKAGDGKELFEGCRQAGRKTRKMEKYRLRIEKSLLEMDGLLENAIRAAENKQENRFRKHAASLVEEIEDFPRYVSDYESEVQVVRAYLEELRTEPNSGISDFDAQENLSQEILAYEQVVTAAEAGMEEYLEKENILSNSLSTLEEAVEILDEYEDEELEVGGDGQVNTEDEQDPDWTRIKDILNDVVIPSAGNGSIAVDEKKVSALDRLEEVLQGDLLDLVLPEGVDVSENKVTLSGNLSDNLTEQNGTQTNILEQFLINEYCFLCFDSFLERCERNLEPAGQPLAYEQEYLLCGKSTDRQNLKATVERLLTIRGAMNLIYLLGSPDKKAEADSLAAAVSGGNVPVQLILSFFIMTLWAFGEAIHDVRELLSGGRVAFWKDDLEWKLGLGNLLDLEFMEKNSAGFNGSEESNSSSIGNDYEDYMRILFFIMDKEDRNYRMMDIIQWNIRTVQEDFSVWDCVSEVEIEATVMEKHLFSLKNEYTRTTTAVGIY